MDAGKYEVSPKPSAARKNSSCPNVRERTVAMQTVLQLWRPHRIADLRRTRSTILPTNGAETPYTQANEEPSKPSWRFVRWNSLERSGKTENTAWRSA